MEKVPELLSDCDDLDSEMRLRRFAAATQPSLLLRRFFTNLQRIKQTVVIIIGLCTYLAQSKQESYCGPDIEFKDFSMTLSYQSVWLTTS